MHLLTHRRGSENCSRHLVPTISCVRFVCFTKTNMSRASPSSLLWSTPEILPSSSLCDVNPNAGCQPGNSNFYTATPLVGQYLFVSPPCFSKRVTARRRHRCKFIFLVYVCAFIRLYFSFCCNLICVFCFEKKNVRASRSFFFNIATVGRSTSPDFFFET